MNFQELLARYNIGLRLNCGFLEAEIKFDKAHQQAAWELHVELATRILTQDLPIEHGDESTALQSVYSLFPITRDVLKKQGRNAGQVSKIAVVVLNQIIRPFTAKWHRLYLNNAFGDPNQCVIFREELAQLQVKLRGYSKIMAELAKVEDLTDIEENEPNKEKKRK